MFKPYFSKIGIDEISKKAIPVSSQVSSVPTVSQVVN
jgi:hypothetical protein